MSDVFVSYSRRDTDYVARLADELRERGKDVWVDVEGIRDAEVFPAALRRAIEGSDAFLFVISPDSVQSEFCEQEVAHAAELNKRIVPLALRPVPDGEIPEEIRVRNWIPVDPDGDTGTERVVTAIDTDLDWEQRHTRLTVKALEWDGADRDRSFLLRGSDLATAEQWLAEGVGKDPGPTPLEQEYLLAGRQAASRRQRTLVGGSLVITAIAIGLLVFALISRGKAVTAETSAKSQALAAESVTQQSVDPERAVLLAMAAVGKKVTYGATGTMFALRAALDSSPVRYRLPTVPTQGCGGPGVAYDPAPSSHLIVEGLCNGQLRFASSTTGRVERTVPLGSRQAILVQYNRDGSRLVDAAGDRMLDLDPTTGAVRSRSPVVPGLTTFALAPNAPIAAAIGKQAQLNVWNMATGKMTAIRPTRAEAALLSEISAITFDPNGRQLALSFVSADPSQPGLIVVDLARRKIVHTLHTEVATAAYSPNGSKLLVGEQSFTGGKFVMLDARTLAPDRRFHPVSVLDVEPAAASFSPDGNEIAYGFFDGTAGDVSASTGRQLDHYPGSTAAVTAVSFSPDGTLAATGSADGTVRAWHTGGETLHTLDARGTVNELDPSADGFTSVVSPGTGPGQGAVTQSWTDTGQPSGRPLVISPSPAIGALFIGGGGRFAGVIPAPQGNATRGVIHIWNLAERRIVKTIPIHLPSGSEPVFSPDGNEIAMGVPGPPSTSTGPSAQNLEVLDVRTGRQRIIASQTSCSAGWRGFAWSPSGQELAAGTFCGTGVAAWSVATGKELGRPINLGGELAWGAFSPDGRHIAIASWNGTIEVTPVPVDPARAVSLTENTKGVPQIAYSPDGRYLASAGLDGTIRVFDARTLDELRVIPQAGVAEGLAFTARGQDLVSFGATSAMTMWDTCTDCESPGTLLGLARSRVTRQLTPQERTLYGVS